MKNTITTLLFLCTLWQSAAAQTADSSQLAVFNTGRNITVLSTDFGAALTEDLIGDMVMAYDTVMVLKAHSAKDSTGRYPKRYQIERRATKISNNLRGKIAVIDYNKDYDVTQMCLNAQKAGAKAVIIIHESDDKKLYKLGKKGVYKDSIRIPVFTIPNKKGEQIQQLLPSMVGIKKRTPPPIQALAVLNTVEDLARRDSIYKAEQEQYLAVHAFTGKGWIVSPNPANDEVVIQYNLERKATVNIDIFNDAGQVLKTYELKDAQTGRVNVDVSAWHNGNYNVSVRSGSLKQVKKLLVMH
jgi:hypothetical protein